ncbi:MAG: CapA family protein [Minisyncoccia bacterium]|jgi:poly-gamma-glutamate synthesis protein (capsule biosynthesis protein)
MKLLITRKMVACGLVGILLGCCFVFAIYFINHHYQNTSTIAIDLSDHRPAIPLPTATPEPSVSFIIGGDVMFARMINHTFGNDFNDAFSNLGSQVFSGYDAAIINLEGAITDKPIPDNVSARTTMIFRFPPAVANTLSYLHINGVSQANNHSDNAGAEGIATTRSVLASAGIQTFGGPAGNDISRIAVFHGLGLSLTVIGVNMLAPGQIAEALVPIIEKAKQDPSMRVLVMPHWGVEYKAGHTTAQAQAAHVWIDAGADIVIGSHPHVIEDAELYHGAPIIYSLGNFLFDQTFSKETREGLLIAGDFTPNGLTFSALPIQSINYKPQLMTDPGKQQILDSLYVPFRNYLQTTSAGIVVEIKKQKSSGL